MKVSKIILRGGPREGEIEVPDWPENENSVGFIELDKHRYWIERYDEAAKTVHAIYKPISEN